MSFFSETTIKAVRKRHRCDGCDAYIEIGEPARRWAGMTDGDFGHAIFHPDCREAEVALNGRLRRYLDEWIALSEIDSDDVPWLKDAFPAVAARMSPNTQEGEANG